MKPIKKRDGEKKIKDSDRKIAGAGGQAAEGPPPLLLFRQSLFGVIHHPATLRHDDQISQCHSGQCSNSNH